MSFSDDIKRFKNKAEKAINALYRTAALEVCNKIIKRTPVDTGRLIGNWQTSLNHIPSGEVENTSEAIALRINARVTGKAKITDRIYLVNNLPYAQAIENGHSKNFPLGMVKVTIAEWQRIVKKMAKKAK